MINKGGTTRFVPAGVGSAADSMMSGLQTVFRESESVLRQGGVRSASSSIDRLASLYALALTVISSDDAVDAAVHFLEMTVALFATDVAGQRLLRQRWSGNDASSIVHQTFGAVVRGLPKDAGTVVRTSSSNPDQIFFRNDDRDLTPSNAQAQLGTQQALDNETIKDAENRRARLVRRQVSAIAQRLSLALPSVSAGVGRRTSRRAATGAAQRFARPTRHLDVGRTIEQSLAKGGLFAPIWRKRGKSPEYIILSAQLSSSDLEHSRIAALAHDLRAQGVDITIYPYDVDPRLLTDTLRDGRPKISLREIQQRHPDARLVIAATGRELLHPFTMDPLDWTNAMASWPRRALVTPIPSVDWGVAERVLYGALGFSLSSSREHLLDNLGDLLGGAGPVAIRTTTSTHSVTPLFVAQQRLSYLMALPPAEEEQLRLVQELKAYLGTHGFAWLAVCAYFPAMNAPIALFFGKLLEQERVITGGTAPIFSRLSTLPWMRFGHMPFWARRLVSNDLSKAEQQRARAIAARIFDGSVLSDQIPSADLSSANIEGNGPGGVVLPIHLDSSSELHGLQIDDLAIDMLAEGGDEIDPLLSLSVDQMLREKIRRRQPRKLAESSDHAAGEKLPLTDEEADRLVASYPSYIRAHGNPPEKQHLVQLDLDKSELDQGTNVMSGWASILWSLQSSPKRGPARVLIVPPPWSLRSECFLPAARPFLEHYSVSFLEWRRFGKRTSTEPLSFDTYIEDVRGAIDLLSPGIHVVGLDMGGTAALAATAFLAETDPKRAPRSLTLVAAPIDCRINPSPVNHMWSALPIEYVKRRFGSLSPASSSRALNECRNLAYLEYDVTRGASLPLLRWLGKEPSLGASELPPPHLPARAIPMDVLVDVVDRLYVNHQLAQGAFVFREHKLNFESIRRTALLTVEAERDDWVSVGQTAAAHDLVTKLRPHLRSHHLQPGVGHFGAMSGAGYEGRIVSAIRSVIDSTDR